MTRRRSLEERTAEAWIELQRNWWSYDALQAACDRQPSKAWRILVRLSEILTTPELIEIFGAGPLQDFVRNHAPRFIQKIEGHAVRSATFRRALRKVWVPRAEDDVSTRLFSLGCRPLEIGVEPWQTAPLGGTRIRVRRSAARRNSAARPRRRVS